MSESSQSDDVFVITFVCTDRKQHEQVEVGTLEMRAGETARARGYIAGPNLLAPKGRKYDAPAPSRLSVSMLCPKCRRNPQFRTGAGGRWNELLAGCVRADLTIVDISLVGF